MDHFETNFSFYYQSFFLILENISDPFDDFLIDELEKVILNSFLQVEKKQNNIEAKIKYSHDPQYMDLYAETAEVYFEEFGVKMGM